MTEIEIETCEISLAKQAGCTSEEAARITAVWAECRTDAFIEQCELVRQICNQIDLPALPAFNDYGEDRGVQVVGILTQALCSVPNRKGTASASDYGTGKRGTRYGN